MIISTRKKKIDLSNFLSRRNQKNDREEMLLLMISWANHHHHYDDDDNGDCQKTKIQSTKCNWMGKSLKTIKQKFFQIPLYMGQLKWFWNLKKKIEISLFIIFILVDFKSEEFHSIIDDNYPSCCCCCQFEGIPRWLILSHQQKQTRRRRRARERERNPPSP